MYASTKGGILSFTKSLAIDEARNFVRVNCILLGNIKLSFMKSKSNAVAILKHMNAARVWHNGLEMPVPVSMSLKHACFLPAMMHSLLQAHQ